MVRRRAETACEHGGSLTLCPSLLSLFPTAASISAFCVLFLALSEMGMVKACSFCVYVPHPSTSTTTRLPLSLGLLVLKCENAGNDLALKMWAYRKSLGRPVLRHSLCLSVLWSLPVAGAILCLSFCQNILFQFSALLLPNSCHRQLDGVDAAKALLPAHFPAPCHAPSFPGPNRHKLIGLNPVINRLEKQLSMFVSLPKAGLFGHRSPLFFPVFQFCQHTTASCPVLPSSLAPTARARLTSLWTLDVGLKWVTIPPVDCSFCKRFQDLNWFPLVQYKCLLSFQFTDLFQVLHFSQVIVTVHCRLNKSTWYFSSEIYTSSSTETFSWKRWNTALFLFGFARVWSKWVWNNERFLIKEGHYHCFSLNVPESRFYFVFLGGCAWITFKQHFKQNWSLVPK